VSTIVSFGQSTIYHNAPEWRYNLYLRPDEFLDGHLRAKIIEQGSKRQKLTGRFQLRTLQEGDQRLILEPEFHLSEDLLGIINDLTPRERRRFWKVHKSIFEPKNPVEKNVVQTKKEKVRKPKYKIVGTRPDDEVTAFRLRHLDDIQDAWLRRLIRYMSGFGDDPPVREAMKIKSSIRRDEIVRYIKYYSFLGETDAASAKLWKEKVKTIEAIRMLFCDFTRLPSNPVAKLTYMRQMLLNQQMDDRDFAFMKLINELGEVGIRQITSASLVNPEERPKIESYLRDSALQNILEFKLSIKTAKDSMMYHGMLTELANTRIKEAQVQVQMARIDNLVAATEKIKEGLAPERTVDEHENLGTLLEQTIKDVKTLSLQEHIQPALRSIKDLDEDEDH